MTTQLRQLAEAFCTSVGFISGSEKIYRHFNASLNKIVVVYISETEPTRVLPLNCVWLNMNRDGDYYMQFLRRVSKAPSSPFANTWEPITVVASVYADQYYDAEDGTPDSVKVEIATDAVYGIAKLTQPAAFPDSPIFVADTDPRLSDDRYPTYHTHPEKPLRKILGVVYMDNGDPSVGATFVAVSATTAHQRRVTLSDFTE